MTASSADGLAVRIAAADPRIELTSLDRVLWPQTGTTKCELLDYYATVAPVLLPHVAGKPLTLGRWPGGVDAPGFAATECRARPDWVRAVPVMLRSGAVRHYCAVHDVASLLWVVNQGTIELHVFPTAAERPDEPNALILDLDPGPGVDAGQLCTVALDARASLRSRGLAALAKTSGAGGMHVVAPLARGGRFEQTSALAHAIAAELAEAAPAVVTDRDERSLRRGRVYVDCGGNHARRTTVAPYSLRATDRPTVSTPLGWDEVAAAAGDRDASLEFGPDAAVRRVDQLADLWAPPDGART